MNDPVNPLLIPAQRKNHKLPCILSSSDVLHLLNGIPSLKYRAVLSLCYGSGLRISEALRIQISDIDSSKMRLFVRQSKGRRERYTLLSHYSHQLLRQYWKKFKPQGSLLFPGRHAGRPIPVQHVQAEMKTAVSCSALKSKGKITTHTLRHCFATHLLDAGCNLRTIQLFMGHASINSTCIYLHLTDQHFSSIQSPIDREDGDSLVL
jgi:site-specific recombinase XerD